LTASAARKARRHAINGEVLLHLYRRSLRSPGMIEATASRRGDSAVLGNSLRAGDPPHDPIAMRSDPRQHGCGAVDAESQWLVSNIDRST
jgi:hypothetical protein